MRLAELLAALPPGLAPLRTRGRDPHRVPIRGLAIDSRRVAAGDLFVAIEGEHDDGHAHLGQALTLGAAGLLVERDVPGLRSGDLPVIEVPDTRVALPHLAACFFGHPSRELDLIGVTGTNGKTSTCYLIESILLAAGRRAGLIGTVEVRFGDERWRPLHTTPESIELQRTLRAMRTHGIDSAAMEVSSHGLALSRIEGCHFAAVAFTNLTQDHLDFHKTMDGYRMAKTLLFRRHLRPEAVAVVNLDDAAAPAFVEAAREQNARRIGVSRRPGVASDVGVESAETDLAGTRARLRLPSGSLDVRLPLVGDFNVENLLVATGVAMGLGIEPEAIARGVEACRQVPGRVERVAADAANAPTVVVDYAHTPDALDKLLATLRPLARRRLVVVFGCGGNRDRGKRPLMAEAAARWCDRVIVTSDNPRHEDPASIVAEIESGLGKLRRVEPGELDATPSSYASVLDRLAAIELALEVATPEDTVVIAGKGHEDYQILGAERIRFDDREVVRRLLEARGAR